MLNLFFGLFILLSASSLAYLFLNQVAGEETHEDGKLQRRLDQLLVRHTAAIAQQARFSDISALNQMLKRQKFSQKLYELLILSGWTMPLSVFLFLDLLWGAVVYLVVYLISHSFPPAFLSGLAMAGLPYWFLVINKRRYVEKFTLHLPDSLMMMKNALRAGQGIQGAFHVVGEEGPKPVCLEFQRLVREIELGSHLNEALNMLYRRIQTVDLRILVLGIFIQQEVGGNLGELFDHIEKTIRERLSLSREIKALTAQGKMTGIVLVLLPVFFVLALKVINPTYFDPLLQDEAGRAILAMAIAMQFIGAYLIRRMTRFSLAY